MKDVYTEAIVQLLNSGSEIDLILTKTKALMEKKGHKSLYPEVLKAVIFELEEQGKKEAVTIAVAKNADKNSDLVKNTLAALGLSKTTSKIVVDDTIIGGATFLYKNQFSDLSFKTTLTKLYQAITA